MEWISVEQRLPEVNGPYLIYTDIRGCENAYYSPLNKTWDTDSMINEKPTHWMPIPDPPEASMTEEVEA